MKEGNVFEEALLGLSHGFSVARGVYRISSSFSFSALGTPSTDQFLSAM